MGKGEDGGFRTVECLRGRLLAERMASKAANEEAEVMTKRLLELERMVAIEIKSMNRAEKKFKCALKKLESLKFLGISGQINRPEGSESSSSKCSSGLQLPEKQKPKSHCGDTRQYHAEGEEQDTLDVLNLENPGAGDENLGNLSADSVNQLASQEGSWSSVGTAHSHNNADPCQEETIKFKDSLHSGGSMNVAIRQSSVTGEELDGAIHQTEDTDGDDSLALVPASLWLESRHGEPKIDDNVQRVLVALRHVKEQLQSSLGRNAVSSSRELYGL